MTINISPTLSFYLNILPICISILALVISLLSFVRKDGIRLRGSFGIASGISSQGKYVWFVTIENMKDRAVTIFGIYLRIYPNYFVELENLQSDPLKLPAYESHHKEYGPIEFYSVSTKKIAIDHLLDDKKIKKQLVLSTNKGRYIIFLEIKHWNPIKQFFQNYSTAPILTIRSTYKNVDVGGGVKFMVEIIYDQNRSQVIPIHDQDFMVRTFRNFSLTKDILFSKDSLETFLRYQMDKGRLKCQNVSVFDMTAWRNEVYKNYPGDIIKGEPCTRFRYYIIGWIGTRISNWRNSQKNRSNRL